jgi:hypothetical protein
MEGRQIVKEEEAAAEEESKKTGGENGRAGVGWKRMTEVELV